MLRLMMGVLGWGGGDVHVPCDVARMVGATVMMGVLGWGGGDVNVPGRCTHGRCYGNDGCLGLGWG